MHAVAEAKITGGGKRSAGFEYWLWLGRFFGWVGWWAFIESSSPVRLKTPHVSIHRSISLNINWLIDPSIVLLTYLLIRLLALSFLFWLVSASDHRSRTPTTTPFQYSPSLHANIADLEHPQQTVVFNRHNLNNWVSWIVWATCGPSYLSSLYRLGETYCRYVFWAWSVFCDNYSKATECSGSKSNGKLTVSGMIKYNYQDQRGRTKTFYQRIDNAPPV